MLALEALTTTLRAHLTRLTSELTSHHLLLGELRALCEADNRALKSKFLELDRLCREVERLAGEVEVMRTVVEEGLKERRLVRETHSGAHVFSSDAGQQSVRDRPNQREADKGYCERHEPSKCGDREPELASQLLHPLSTPDGIVPTDHVATGILNPLSPPRLSESDPKMHQAKPDLGEPALPLPRPEPPASQGTIREGDKPELHNENISAKEVIPASPPASVTGLVIHQAGPHPQPESTKLASPRPPIAGQKYTIDPGMPFPRIRGSRLEQLFFRTSEHYLKTCIDCNRRRRLPLPAYRSLPSCLPNCCGVPKTPVRDTEGGNEDEGFVEGSSDVEQQHPFHTTTNAKGKERQGTCKESGGLQGDVKQTGLPPQTTLARVVRELEDDFTHYKRFASPPITETIY